MRILIHARPHPTPSPELPVSSLLLRALQGGPRGAKGEADFIREKNAKKVTRPAGCAVTGKSSSLPHFLWWDALALLWFITRRGKNRATDTEINPGPLVQAELQSYTWTCCCFFFWGGRQSTLSSSGERLARSTRLVPTLWAQTSKVTHFLSFAYVIREGTGLETE